MKKKINGQTAEMVAVNQTIKEAVELFNSFAEGTPEPYRLAYVDDALFTWCIIQSRINDRCDITSSSLDVAENAIYFAKAQALRRWLKRRGCINQHTSLGPQRRRQN